MWRGRKFRSGICLRNVYQEDTTRKNRGNGMKWIVGDGPGQRPVDLAGAIEYVRAGAAPGQHHLVVARADAAEYLNLFLAWERAMVFWVRFQVGLPHILVAHRPGPPSPEGAEVAFAGQTPDRPWFVPVADTLPRAEGLALLEEYVRTGSAPTELPTCGTEVKRPPPLQLLLFEEATPPEPEDRTVRWEPWGSIGLWQGFPKKPGEEGGLPF